MSTKTKLTNFRAPVDWKKRAHIAAPHLGYKDLSDLIRQAVDEKIKRAIVKNPDLRSALKDAA